MLAKTHLYSLIDMLPESEIYSAKRYLEFLISKVSDPLLQTLFTAPYDDEPVEKEELQAFREAEKDISEGKTQSLESVMREFGL
ncbi:MAG: hypothetical protein BWK80_08445 [Desulfobacteraceae bacterium IS3]|nr:MAG: hypothetical protein BWK80_08445 [Desulfobacteraceae bacterium IS3]HAO20203.1 hypothetical protein [Desulfobacteraceae bacterium]